MSLEELAASLWSVCSYFTRLYRKVHPEEWKGAIVDESVQITVDNVGELID
jgi:nitrogen regulatory protein PII-like uncharacterized protein